MNAFTSSGIHGGEKINNKIKPEEIVYRKSKIVNGKNSFRKNLGYTRCQNH
jgi:hypothetical protein